MVSNSNFQMGYLSSIIDWIKLTQNLQLWRLNLRNCRDAAVRAFSGYVKLNCLLGICIYIHTPRHKQKNINTNTWMIAITVYANNFIFAAIVSCLIFISAILTWPFNAKRPHFVNSHLKSVEVNGCQKCLCTKSCMYIWMCIFAWIYCIVCM